MFINRLTWLFVGLVGVASAAAPVSEPTDQQRLERLERRVGKITELTLQLDGLKQENRTLRGEIETLNYRIEQFERKQRDRYLDIDQRLSAMAGAGSAASTPVTEPAEITSQMKPDPADPASANSSPAPSPVAPVANNTQNNPAQIKADYDAAYALLSPAQRRYKEAIQAFQTFLRKYPNSTLAGNAQYWLGEAHYVSQDNAAALVAFEKVTNDYPDSSKIPGALYKIGRIHQVKGDLNAARAALQRITQDYPNSSAASLARERLIELDRKQ